MDEYRKEGISFSGKFLFDPLAYLGALTGGRGPGVEWKVGTPVHLARLQTQFPTPNYLIMGQTRRYLPFKPDGTE